MHILCNLDWLELLFAPVALNCSHNFCQHCIGIWRKEKNTCPCCRELIKSENRVNTLDKIIEMVESEMAEQDETKQEEFKKKREEQKKKCELFKEDCRPRQVGNAIPEPIVARNETQEVMTEFVAANGMLSQVRIQFDHAPVVINPEDTEFELFRNAFNTNEEYERQELL